MPAGCSGWDYSTYSRGVTVVEGVVSLAEVPLACVTIGILTPVGGIGPGRPGGPLLVTVEAVDCVAVGAELDVVVAAGAAV